MHPIDLRPRRVHNALRFPRQTLVFVPSAAHHLGWVSREYVGNFQFLVPRPVWEERFPTSWTCPQCGGGSRRLRGSMLGVQAAEARAGAGASDAVDTGSGTRPEACTGR